MSEIDIPRLEPSIQYQDRLFLIGSCFTEHIGNALAETKFSTLQNPNGILFDPASIWRSLEAYMQQRLYTVSDFFLQNEVWHSWDHHSRFSKTDPDAAVQAINQSQVRAHEFLRQSSWLIITLGSSFVYRLTGAGAGTPGRLVANCHRAPASWFDKELLPVNEMVDRFSACFEALHQFNPRLKVLLTISPVRHLREGVVNNNRSKARLIEVVHQLVALHPPVHYFPAYELVVDILRDYRFYDIDFAHPNYQATEFVLEKFVESCINPAAVTLMKELRSIALAKRHRPMQPDTNAHRSFLRDFLEKTKRLAAEHPYLDLRDELAYFSAG